MLRELTDHQQRLLADAGQRDRARVVPTGYGRVRVQDYRYTRPADKQARGIFARVLPWACALVAILLVYIGGRAAVNLLSDTSDRDAYLVANADKRPRQPPSPPSPLPCPPPPPSPPPPPPPPP